MTADDDAEASLIDWDRSALLREVDGVGWVAATAIRPDGSSHLVIARVDRLGDATATYDATPDTDHEQLGPLPLEFVRRLTISHRRRR